MANGWWVFVVQQFFQLFIKIFFVITVSGVVSHLVLAQDTQPKVEPVGTDVVATAISIDAVS